MTRMCKPELYIGIILAGGWSKRYGREKATVEWKGKWLIDHVAVALRSVCCEVIAVARPEQETDLWAVDRVVFDDPSLPEGPLRGISAGLSHVAGPAFVVACDNPLIQPALLGLMRDQDGEEWDALAPMWDNQLQPLLAVYRPSCLPRFQERLHLGVQSPKAALAHVRLRKLDEPSIRFADPLGLSFININQPEDLRALSNGTS